MKKIGGWRGLVLIALCIVMNLIGNQIAIRLQLPFWLDAIGTLICAIVLGPVGGALCGALTSLVTGFMNPVYLIYIVVSVGIGISVGLLFPKTQKYSIISVASTAVFAGIVAVVLSTPINFIMYKGYTGNIWGDALVDMLSRNVHVPVLCMVLGEAFIDIPDKSISVFIAIGLIYAYRKIFDRRKFTKLVLLLTAAASLMFFKTEAYAYDFSADFAAVRYDTDDGLETIEINTIAQGADGYIYAGAYSGLYRFDGYRFEALKIDERINNVMCLFVDSNGYLWIGTNDSGVACWRGDDDIIFYTKKEGLAANAIRAICEDNAGNIYVGTTANLSVIDKEGTLYRFTDFGIIGVYNLTCGSNGVVAGITNSGDVVFVRGKEVVTKHYLMDENVDYSSITAVRNGMYLVGTTSNYVQQIVLENDKAVSKKKYYIEGVFNFNKLIYSEKYSGYFYCCENGKGFLTKEGKATYLIDEDFDSSISCSMIDHQGNIWFSSNKRGIVKYSWNPFENIFAKADVDSEVVNSVLVKDGLLYVGTNTGLVTIDLKTYYSVPINHPEIFDGVRIRHLMEDSRGNLWVSTYGENGLIEITDNGDVIFFNELKKKTEGSRFRMTLELSDGTIVAASTTGLSFIKDGEVVKTMDEKQGLTTQVLSMVESQDGAILAGTDGTGVFIIDNGKIVEHYDEKNGLDSLVILKVVPCDDGYIYVTSNALYYLDKNNNLRKLAGFPYKNNYDVFLVADNKVWITSSAGIFVVDKADLLADGEYSYMLLNKGRGLYSSLTANATCCFYGNDLFLCCSDGVQKMDIHGIYDNNTNYDIRLTKLLLGDEIIKPNEEGKYIIPASMDRIQINVSVLNYTLSNPMLHIYLEGTEDDGVICYQREMKNLSYLSLPYGEYTLHVQVLDLAGKKAVKEETYLIEKESQMFERTYFKIYLFTVCALFVLFAGWLIGSIRVGMNSFEKLKTEIKIDGLTGFFNKSYSEQELRTICKEKSGALLVLDIDNFKLINDLHGHEMGDSVLMGFADIVRANIRDEDFVGRIGGDEFVMFITNATEEGTISEKVRILNNEVKNVAINLIGENVNIPIGVSAGVVLVPDGGTDYNELFRNADKALYNVKQNGKHGYALYRNDKSSPGSKKTNATGIDSIKMILGERNPGDGAYYVDFDKLQVVYRLLKRLYKRTLVNVWLVEFVLNGKDGNEVDSEVMDKFLEVLSINIRSNDVVSLSGKNQVVVIMTDIAPHDGNTPIERIIREWNMVPGHENYELSYEADAM